MRAPLAKVGQEDEKPDVVAVRKLAVLVFGGSEVDHARAANKIGGEVGAAREDAEKAGNEACKPFQLIIIK